MSKLKRGYSLCLQCEKEFRESKGRAICPGGIKYLCCSDCLQNWLRDTNAFRKGVRKKIVDLEVVKAILAREIAHWRKKWVEVPDDYGKWAIESNHKLAGRVLPVVHVLYEVLYHLTGGEVECPDYMTMFRALAAGTFEPAIELPEPKYWEREGGP